MEHANILCKKNTACLTVLDSASILILENTAGVLTLVNTVGHTSLTLLNLLNTIRDEFPSLHINKLLCVFSREKEENLDLMEKQGSRASLEDKETKDYVE